SGGPLDRRTPRGAGNRNRERQDRRVHHPGKAVAAAADDLEWRRRTRIGGGIALHHRAAGFTDEVLAKRAPRRILCAPAGGPAAVASRDKEPAEQQPSGGAPYRPAHHQNASLPQLEKFWLAGVVATGGVGELGGWNRLSMPPITMLVVDGFF